MEIRFPSICAFLLSLVAATASAQQTGPQPRVQLRLELKDFTEPLQSLTSADREAVDEAIRAIGRSEHVFALQLLSRLSTRNRMNSAVRILRAYVLLEVGNIAGSLEEARTAESSGLHSAYRCWFLAQVASVAGNKSLCRREIKHLQGSEYAAEAVKLGEALNNRAK